VSRALTEQGHRVRTGYDFEIGFRRFRQAEGSQGPDGLSDDPQGLAACGKHTQPWTASQQTVGDVGDRVSEMLAVVEHEQDAPVAHMRHRCLDRGLPWLVVQSKSSQDRADHQFRPGERSQLDHPDAIGKAGQEIVGKLVGQTGLSDSAGSDHRQEPRRHQLMCAGEQLFGSAEE
jgi:hypothetical protein